MKKHIFKNFIILFILFSIFIFITANNYVSATFNDIYQNTFRLHIIANSNSIEDQNLKLKVRDSIIDYFNSLNISSYKKEDIIKVLKNHTNEISSVCSNTLKEYGCNLPINIFIGNSFFPTKNYSNISFPAGTYTCLKILIGNASGENWWCSLFPPLCFADITNGYIKKEDKDLVKENLSDEEYLLLYSDNTSIKFKFKIIEIINSLKSSQKLSG